MAKVLASLENIDLRQKIDPLRRRLEDATGLPFAPSGYTVWRNYKRVFSCCLLASEINNRLICTELCHQLNGTKGSEIEADEYFSEFIKRFYFPSPIFQGYSTRGEQVFPICAVLKFLLARGLKGDSAEISIDEIKSYILGNNCTGKENISFYSSLRPQVYKDENDEIRQVRELIRFSSQISFLKWNQPKLFLDIDFSNKEIVDFLKQSAEPEVKIRKSNAADELLQLGQSGKLGVIPIIPTPSTDADVYFSEGSAKRVTHLRYERSSKLRQFFFESKSKPHLCDICTLNATERYPWTVNILEVHHLLPLSSPIRIETKKTSLSELVGICPNCHKATHYYYRKWLNAKKQEDFASYEEAKFVYEEAKTSAIID
jgi:hypothetical protein